MDRARNVTANSRSSMRRWLETHKQLPSGKPTSHRIPRARLLDTSKNGWSGSNKRTTQNSREGLPALTCLISISRGGPVFVLMSETLRGVCSDAIGETTKGGEKKKKQPTKAA